MLHNIYTVYIYIYITYPLSFYSFPSHPKRSFTLVASHFFFHLPSLIHTWNRNLQISGTRHSNWKLTTTGPPTFTFPFTFLWLGLGFQQAKGAKWSRSGLIGLGCSWLWTIGWCTSRRERVKQETFEKWKGVKVKLKTSQKKITPYHPRVLVFLKIF